MIRRGRRPGQDVAAPIVSWLDEGTCGYLGHVSDVNHTDAAAARGRDQNTAPPDILGVSVDKDLHEVVGLQEGVRNPLVDDVLLSHPVPVRTRYRAVLVDGRPPGRQLDDLGAYGGSG